MPETSPGPSTTPTEGSPAGEPISSVMDISPVNSSSLPIRLLRKAGRFLWYAAKKMAYFVFIIAVVVLILVGLDKVAEVARRFKLSRLVIISANV